MPRRNKRKTAVSEPHRHAPSPYTEGYKQKCNGCSFAGFGFVCLSSDGKCLKEPPPSAREVDNAEIDRGADTKSTER